MTPKRGINDYPYEFPVRADDGLEEWLGSADEHGGPPRSRLRAQRAPGADRLRVRHLLRREIGPPERLGDRDGTTLQCEISRTTYVDP